MRTEALDACALWVAETHVFEEFGIAPYLEITSPMKRCGKSLLLDLLGMVVARPWQASGVTEATLLRKIEDAKPTLLLDEVDSLFGKNSESTEGVRGAINHGYRRGGSIPRCVGPTHQVRDFNVYCPKGFAGIFGNAPDTVADRSVVIQLHRRTKNEKVSKFRDRRVRAEATPLREQLEAWAESAKDSISKHLDATEALLLEEELASLSDRAGDTWEPLLAVAIEAGPRGGRGQSRPRWR